jgi:hypothetical protein
LSTRLERFDMTAPIVFAAGRAAYDQAAWSGQVHDEYLEQQSAA